MPILMHSTARQLQVRLWLASITTNTDERSDMIHTLSEGAQFITTTFRPEMLVTADSFYGVLFSKDKISSIRSIAQEEAMEFVDQVRPRFLMLRIPTDERCVGGSGIIKFHGCVCLLFYLLDIFRSQCVIVHRGSVLYITLYL
jgi:hypothetical protein